MKLQVLVQFEVRDQPLRATPRGFKRLERRRVQQRTHLVADGGIDRGDMARLLRCDVGHDVRRDDAADQGIDATGRRGRSRFRRCRRPTAEQLGEQVIASHRVRVGQRRRCCRRLQRGGRLRELRRVEQSLARLAQRAEHVEAGLQAVGVEVVDLPEADLARRQAQPWRQPLHDRVELVEIHPPRRPLRQRRALGGRPGAEIADQQQPHRPPAGAAPSLRTAGAETEFHACGHRQLLVVPEGLPEVGRQAPMTLPQSRRPPLFQAPGPRGSAVIVIDEVPAARSPACRPVWERPCP